MVEPEHRTTTQYKRDTDVYETYKHKDRVDKRDTEVYETYKHRDRVASILMLNSMRNDLMLRFENNHSAMAA